VSVWPGEQGSLDSNPWVATHQLSLNVLIFETQPTIASPSQTCEESMGEKA
jgi:hypothetical protein